MGLQIFVEDRLADAYEVLALRGLGLPTTPRDRSRVKVSARIWEDAGAITDPAAGFGPTR